MGGEKYLPCFNADGFVGSPPRWRGKAVKFRCTCGLQRITPAWAGKSYVFGPFRPGSWDHPRVGGEKQIGGDNGLDKQGSPPRGRGKGMLVGHSVISIRITPAWAGKRARFSGVWLLSRDHPRVGGEKFSVLTGHKIA